MCKLKDFNLWYSHYSLTFADWLRSIPFSSSQTNPLFISIQNIAFVTTINSLSSNIFIIHIHRAILWSWQIRT